MCIYIYIYRFIHIHTIYCHEYKQDLFVPNAAFEVLVKKLIQKMEEPATLCVRLVREELKQVFFFHKQNSMYLQQSPTFLQKCRPLRACGSCGRAHAHSFPQKSPMYLQKSPTFPQKSCPRYACDSCAKSQHRLLSAKHPHLSANELFFPPPRERVLYFRKRALWPRGMEKKNGYVGHQECMMN